MYHDVGSLQTVIDEASCEMKISTDIERFMIICGYIKEIGNFRFGMGYFYSLGCSQQCFDLMFQIMIKVLLRVLMFQAASRLPIQSPPRPCFESIMQEQSSRQTCLGGGYINNLQQAKANFYYSTKQYSVIIVAMGNESQPTLRLNEDPSLQFHSTSRHPLHGEVKVFTCRSLPMTYIMRLEREPAHSRLYHLFQQIQDIQNPSLLTLYGFKIMRSQSCSSCSSHDLTVEYWQFLNYTFEQHIQDRKRRKAPFTQHQLWHLIQTVCQGALLLQKFGLIWQVNPNYMPITPEGKLKCSWSHLQANNTHLQYFRSLNQFLPDLRQQQKSKQSPDTLSQKQQDMKETAICDYSGFLSPEQKSLLIEKQRSFRMNLEKCNAYKFGLLLAYALTFKQSTVPIQSYELKYLFAELIANKYPYKFLQVLQGTLQIDPKQRWTLQTVQHFCKQDFNPNYELLISEGRRQDLQQFNMEAQIKAQSNKRMFKQLIQPSETTPRSVDLPAEGVRMSQNYLPQMRSRQSGVTDSVGEQRLVQLRQYRKQLHAMRQKGI